MNFPRILLIAMNDGVDLTSGKRFTSGCGHFTDMTSYEELLHAWDHVVRALTRASVIVENAIDLASEREVPDILCSTLTQDCLGRGKTIKEGGAVYDFISGLQVGIANMADGLFAIRKLVYEEKAVSKEVRQVIHYGYDRAGRLTERKEELDSGLAPLEGEPRYAVTRYRYDGNGNRLTETDALGHTTTSEYDAAGTAFAAAMTPATAWYRSASRTIKTESTGRHQSPMIMLGTLQGLSAVERDWGNGNRDTVMT